MSWSQASTTTGFYSGMNYTVSDLGGFTGSLAMGHMAYLANKKNTQIATDASLKEMGHDTDSEGNPLGKDPLSKVENFLVGMYESICGSFSRLKEGVGGLFESVKNWSDDKGFMTDAEVTTKLDELKLRKAELETKTQLANLNNAGDKNVMSDGSPEVSAELAAMKAADDLNSVEKEIAKLESSDKGILSKIGSAIVNFPESIKNKFLCGVYGLNGEADVLDAKLEKVRNQAREMTSERAKGNIYYEALKNDKIFSVRLYEAITSGTTLEGEANMILNAVLKCAPELVKDMQDMNAEHGRVGQGCSPIQRGDYESESKYKEAQKQFVKDILKDYTKAYLKEHKDAALSWLKRDAALNGMSDSTAIFGGVTGLAIIALVGKFSVDTESVKVLAEYDKEEKTGKAEVRITRDNFEFEFNAEKSKYDEIKGKGENKKEVEHVKKEIGGKLLLNSNDRLKVGGGANFIDIDGEGYSKKIFLEFFKKIDSTEITIRPVVNYDKDLGWKKFKESQKSLEFILNQKIHFGGNDK